MAIFKKNKYPNKYWFRKRRGILTKDLGFGWRPISWQGWMVTLGFAIFVFWTYQSKGKSWDFLLYTLIAIFIFGVIADSKSSEQVIFKRRLFK